MTSFSYWVSVLSAWAIKCFCTIFFVFGLILGVGWFAFVLATLSAVSGCILMFHAIKVSGLHRSRGV
jgi:hypothetical protein